MLKMRFHELGGRIGSRSTRHWKGRPVRLPPDLAPSEANEAK